MANHLDQHNTATTDKDVTTWQLNALTEALGDLTLTVSDSLSIGRGNDNDVVLGSKSVSRNHASLSVLEGQLYVKDLESSNGTFINDQRIEGSDAKRLDVDDTVGFASFTFQVAAPVQDSSVSAPVIESGADEQDRVASTTKEVDQLSTTDKPAVEKESTVEVNTVTKSSVVESTASVTAAAISESETAAKEAISSNNTTNDKKTFSDNKAASEKQTTIKEPIQTDMVETASTTDEPAINETMIKDVMASTVDENTSPAAAVVEPILLKNTLPNEEDEQETMMSNDKSDKTLKTEPLAQEPITNEPTTDEPLMKDTASHQESVVKPEHDKTTTTTLQEEADPDVLRAKQAATAQFSGTANLGQGRDLGTEGNNAMDQAVDNPANPGQVEKKPSGGWFIWVFIVILIIGVALWLFNMGGV